MHIEQRLLTPGGFLPHVTLLLAGKHECADTGAHASQAELLMARMRLDHGTTKCVVIELLLGPVGTA